MSTGITWSDDDEQTSRAQLTELEADYDAAYSKWQGAVASGSSDVSVATLKLYVQQSLEKWRAYVERLRGRSDAIVANEGTMNRLFALVTDAKDQESILASLRGESVTRADQAYTVNPKTRQTPYSNILGLRRIFRESTRTILFYVSLVFAVLAIATVGYMAYAVYIAGGVAVESAYRGVGGSHRSSNIISA
jgi:hypothetical protein